MLRLLTATAIGVGLLVASNSFAQTRHPNPAPGPAATTVSKLDQQDTNFIKEAAAGGMAEVGLSKIATKSENPEVKLFAEEMVRDQTTLSNELRTIANEAGVEIPKTLNRDHQKIHNQLQSIHGKVFDQQYMQVMVDDHDQAVKLFRQENSLSHDARLKALPKMRETR